MARYDEHGIPIIESQEEADRRKHAAQQLADADDERQFRRDQRRTNDRQFWANVIIGIGTVGSTIFAGFQARSASRAADTAQSTLHELKSGDGARDTHVLAEQAKAQAEAMRSLAQAADKQEKDTAALVNNYSSQLELARSSQALLKLIPFQM